MQGYPILRVIQACQVLACGRPALLRRYCGPEQLAPLAELVVAGQRTYAQALGIDYSAEGGAAAVSQQQGGGNGGGPQSRPAPDQPPPPTTRTTKVSRQAVNRA